MAPSPLIGRPTVVVAPPAKPLCSTLGPVSAIQAFGKVTAW
jgi:hypothetical protein